MSITIYQGSILDVKADAIVNPANSFLNHGGGVAKVIADAATPSVAKWPQRNEMWEDIERDWLTEQRDHPLIATGDAGWTSAGFLPYKGIIHAVGPIYKDGGYHEADLLYSAYMRSYQVAADHDCTSVVFPAISSGIFGMPIDLVAMVAVQAAFVHGKFHRLDTTFALFSDEHVAAFQAEMEMR